MIDLIESINPENNKLTKKELDALNKLKKEPNLFFDSLSNEDKSKLQNNLEHELINYLSRTNVNENNKKFVEGLINSILNKMGNTQPMAEKSGSNTEIQDSGNTKNLKPINKTPIINEKLSVTKSESQIKQPSNGLDKISETNLQELNNKLGNEKVLKWGKVAREERFLSWSEKEVIGTSYITGEYALALINNGKTKEAEVALNDAVNNTIANGGRLTRLYRTNPETKEFQAATNGDVSDISIALGRYINATKNEPNSEFRKKTLEANQLLQKWLNGELNRSDGLNGLQKVGPIVKDSKGSEQKAFRVMSDDNTTLDGIETKWKTSISVENESRRLMSVYLSGDQVLARNCLQALIDSSWMGDQGYFSSGINNTTFKGIDGEKARDALSLMIMAADMMGILEKNKPRFIQAAKQKPGYTLNEDGTFGFPFDHNSNQNSAIPEFMYIDVPAMNLLGLTDIAQKHLRLGDQSQKELNGRYSTEYQKETFNPIGDIMRYNATNSANYYSGKKHLK